MLTPGSACKSVLISKETGSEIAVTNTGITISPHNSASHSNKEFSLLHPSIGDTGKHEKCTV